MWQPIGVRRGTQIVAQILGTLSRLHERGEVHGHLQPELIHLQTSPSGEESAVFLSVEDMVCSLDGADRHSVYRAPEQLLGEAASPASDLHAVGVILFEMLTGQAPWRPEEAIARVEDGPSELPFPLLPPTAKSLDPFLARLVHRDPSFRFAHALDALGALDETTRSVAMSWHGSTPGPPPSEPPSASSPGQVSAPTLETEESDTAALALRGRPVARWWVPAALVGLAATMAVLWSRPPPSEATELPVAISPAALAVPTSPADEIAAPDNEPAAPAPATGELGRVVKDTLPPPPSDTSHRSIRRRTSGPRLSPSMAEPGDELPGESSPQTDTPPEPEETSAPVLRRADVRRAPRLQRAPGEVMSQEEAEAWSRTRGGVPVQSFRRKRQAASATP